MKLPRGALRVLSKEIRETRRDRNLVVNLVLVPLFLYPMLGFGAFQVLQVVRGVSERAKPEVVVSPAVPAALRDSLFAREEIAATSDPSRWAALGGGRDSSAVRDAWKSQEAPPAVLLSWDTAGRDSAVVFHDGSRDRSRAAKEIVLDELRDWRRAAILERAQARGLGSADVEPWDLEEEDTASASERGREILSLVLPITLLLMLVMGTYYSALDTIVGERERGTLETLLVSPLTRGEILLGKFAYVVLASLTSLFLNLVSLTLFLGLVVRMASDEGSIAVSVHPAAFGIIVAAAALAASFFAALLMLASVPAKTYREGQAALLPYYFGTILLGLSASMSREEFTMREALVPVVNLVALFRSVLRGEYPPGPILAALGVLAGLAALALLAASRAGLREDVTWGGKPPRLVRLLFPGKEVTP